MAYLLPVSAPHTSTTKSKVLKPILENRVGDRLYHEFSLNRWCVMPDFGITLLVISAPYLQITIDIIMLMAHVDLNRTIALQQQIKRGMVVAAIGISPATLGVDYNM